MSYRSNAGICVELELGFNALEITESGLGSSTRRKRNPIAVKGLFEVMLVLFVCFS